MVARRNARKTLSKPLWRISKYQWVLGNKLHRNDQSGKVYAAVYEKRESVKLKESAENAKPRPMGQQQVP